MIIFLVCIAFILLVTSVGVVVTIFYFKIKKRQQLIRYERVEHFPINISTFSQFSILQGKVTNNWLWLNICIDSARLYKIRNNSTSTKTWCTKNQMKTSKKVGESTARWRANYHYCLINAIFHTICSSKKLYFSFFRRRCD